MASIVPGSGDMGMDKSDKDLSFSGAHTLGNN